MSTATLVAVRSFWLNRKSIKVGETFQCADRLAAKLITCGKARAGDDATRHRLRIALIAEWNDADGGEAHRAAGPRTTAWPRCWPEGSRRSGREETKKPRHQAGHRRRGPGADFGGDRASRTLSQAYTARTRVAVAMLLMPSRRGLR